MKKNIRITLIAAIFVCGIVMSLHAASDNIVKNPGFESDMSDWTVSNSGGAGVETITEEDAYSGHKCLKMRNDIHASGTAVQNLGTLVPGQSYIFSAMFKTSVNHCAYIRLKDNNWKNASGSVSPKYFTVKIYGSGKWEKASEIIRIPVKDDFGESTANHDWSVLLYGATPSNNKDTICYDDISFSLGNMFLSQFGPANDSNAKTIDFGSEDESRGGIVYTASAMSEKEYEGNDNYRSVLPKKTVYVDIPAFNVDEKGLPLSPMLLEIRYKDTIDEEKYEDSTHRTYHRAFIYSKIDFYSTEPYSRKERQYYKLCGMGHSADGQWIYEQHLIPKTPFQLLRAIDGKFTLRINMPNEGPDDETLRIPIDYISLRKITDEESRMLSDKNRDLLGFYKVEMPADQPAMPVDYTSGDLVVFTRDIMKPVYPRTKPAEDEIDREMNAVSAPGEIEPISFALYSRNGINDLSFEVSDLTCAEKKTAISKENIYIFKVICGEKRVNSYSSNRPRGYGVIPDRLEIVDDLDIAPDTSERIWLKVHIPENTAGGIYIGSVGVKKNGAPYKSVPLKLDVLDIPLDLPENLNIVYSDPYLRTYSTEMQKVCGLFRETGFDMFMYPQCSNIAQNGKIVDFNIQAVNDEVDKFKQENIAKKGKMIISAPASAIYSYIFKTSLVSSDLNVYERLSSPEFTEAYGMLIRKIIRLGDEKGVSFIFTLIDEPGSDPYKRILADRIAAIIKNNGGKTTVTYYTSCENEISSGEYITPNGVLPPLTGLVDYKVWSPSSLGDGYIKGYENFGYYTTSTSYLRNPIYNRYLHGILACATDAKIVSAYAMGDYIQDPFNDFDATSHYIYPFTYPDFLYAYPTWDDGKLIHTMSLEGIREGIKDAKYAATLKRLISEYPSSADAVAAAAYLNAMFNRIDKNYWAACTSDVSPVGYYGRILSQISLGSDSNEFEAFTEFRMGMAEFIKRILSRRGNEGDVDGNGVVDIVDLILVSREMGMTSGFNPANDQNGDQRVDIMDLITVIRNME